MAEKAIYGQVLDELLGVIEKTQHELRAECAKLKAQNEALREALVGVTPSHRTPGTCWCGYGRDIEVGGHERGCLAADLALTSALERSGRIKQNFNGGRSLEVTPRRDTLLDAIAAERERCARIVSGHANCGTFAHGGPYGCTREIDRQIREGE